LNYKPMLAAAVAGLGVMAFSSPALADGLSGDPAIKSSSPFRLNPYTLEPGCFRVGRGDDIDIDTHIDLKSLVDGDGFVKELHLTVDEDAHFSVDQVLVPSASDGYRIYNAFDTGTVDDDPDVDPNQTAVDLFAPNGDRIDKDDVIVCVSDHDGGYYNRPYVQEAGGLVAAINRPIIQPTISCLGASAIEPLNTYKVGFGYTVKGYNMDDRAVILKGIKDPNAVDFNHDGTPDAVYIKAREDGAYDARRVNDVDSFGEEFGKFPMADYGQTELFLLSGDPTAWTLSNNNHPDTLSNLITFTTQGDLPLTWTVRASLAPSSYERFVTIDDAYLRAWEASWQAYYDGGPKPTLRLCPGTNSPAPDNVDVVNLPQAAVTVAPAAAAPAQVVVREITTVGSTQYVQVAGKKASKKASCMKKAKAKKSQKARARAKSRCRRR
jgi:hypothetical protein